jgi:hypothetical protein
MYFDKKYMNIYIVMGIIVVFFLFMFISAGFVMHNISSNTSATMIQKDN